MANQTTHSTARFLAGALALSCAGAISAPLALAQSAGTAAPAAPQSETAVSPIDLARRALDEGRVVEAQAILRTLVQAPTTSNAVAGEWLERTERRLKLMDPVELSLQKAEWAVRTGDLREADRQLAGLSKRTLATDQQARVDQLSKGLTSARESLRPTVETSLAQVAADFETGRYAQAKSQLSAVYRTGIALSPAQQKALDRYQLMIIERERLEGTTFTIESPALAMMQPGVVRRGGPANQPPAPAPTPAPAPAPAQPSEPAPAPAPAPAPMNEPVPAATQPAPQPGATTPAPALAPTNIPADDLIATAMRAESQRLLAEADQAFNEARYNEASRKYQTVLASGRPYLNAEEIKRAEDRQAEAQIRLRTGAGDLAGQSLQNLNLSRERATAEFNNEIEQSKKALAAGQTAAANDLVSRARLTVDRAKTFFSQPEYDAFVKQADELKGQIALSEEKIRGEESRIREIELKSKSDQAQRSLATEKDRRIVDSINRVRALQREQKYEEALQVTEQVLFLEPNNPTALFMRDILGDVVVWRRLDTIKRTRGRNLQELNIQAADSAIPPRSFVNYPSDWPTKSFMRGEGGAYAESGEDRRALAALDRHIPGRFENNTLADIIVYLTKTSQQDFDVDWNSLRNIGVDPETRISLDLNDKPVSVVLDRVLARASRDRQTRASFTVLNGIVTIASEDALRQSTVTQPYNITDLLVEVPNFVDAPDMDLARLIAESSGRGDRRSAGPFGTIAKKDSAPGREQRITKLVAVVQDTVDPQSWRDHGGDTGAIQELNGSLIITTTPANHREIAGLLSKLREIRSMQINVESRFLTVRQDFFEQIGFDIDVYFNVNNNQVTNARQIDDTILPSDFFNFGNVRPLNRTVTGTVTQPVIPPNRFSPIGGGQNSLGITENLVGGFSPFASTVLNQNPALGIAGQFLDDIQVDFLIKATQADRRSTTLTAPRLTLTNGQISNIYVATQRSFISDLTPIVGDSAAGFDPTTAVLTEGVVLQVEVVVSSDRRYVTMNVDTSVSQAERPFRQVPITILAGGLLVSSAASQSFIELPAINTTRIQTTVTVPDEGTVLMGGQRLVTEIEVESGVPVLSKIPILNRFFTNRVQSKEEQTLLILIKPTVLIQTEEEEKNFPGLQDTVRNGLGG